VFLIAGCSSGDGAAAGSSGGSAPTAATSPAANAQVACSRFYAFDLYRRTSARESASTDGAARTQAWKAFRELSTGVVSSVSSAVVINALPAKAQLDAEKIDRILATIRKAGGDLRDVKGPADAKIGRRSVKIEAACVAAGVPVPQENLDAR
jgi:hypothetical protein